MKTYACLKCEDTGIKSVVCNDDGEIISRIRCDCSKGKKRKIKRVQS